MARTRAEHGSLDLIVNAVTREPPAAAAARGAAGRSPRATMDAVRGWTVAVAEQAFAFLSTGARALLEGGGGTLVQVTGGSSRRAMPGRGPWAAGAFAARALTQAAAQELRGQGVHVALLIVDATIESPKTADRTASAPRDSLGDMAADRPGRPVPRRAGAARLHARADGHAGRRDLGAVGPRRHWRLAIASASSSLLMFERPSMSSFFARS